MVGTAENIPVIEVASGPALEPVSVDEALLWMHVDAVEELDRIGVLIKAAREGAEQVLERAIMPQTITETYDCFPAEFRLHRGPIRELTSIEYADQDGNTQTLAPTAYQVQMTARRPRIVPAALTTWPVTQPGTIGAVVVTYKAGWGSAEEVPSQIKTAILKAVAHHFEQRGDDFAGDESPDAVRRAVSALLSAERVKGF